MISFRQIFRRRQMHDDLAEEIQQHLAEEIESLVAGGLTRRDAEFAARRRFGNVALIEEQGSEAWRMANIEGWLSDLKFALRRLKASPGFALTAVITLALGIGANVVVFSVLNGLMLRPLGVPDARSCTRFRAAVMAETRSPIPITVTCGTTTHRSAGCWHTNFLPPAC